MLSKPMPLLKKNRELQKPDCPLHYFVYSTKIGSSCPHCIALHRPCFIANSPTENTHTKIMLHGLTNGKAEGLIPVTKSWSSTSSVKSLPPQPREGRDVATDLLVWIEKKTTKAVKVTLATAQK